MAELSWLQFASDSRVGVALVDSRFRYVAMNACLGDLDHVDCTQVCGCQVSEVLPELSPKILPLYKQVISSGSAIANRHVAIKDRAGTQKYLRVSYRPFTHDQEPCVVVSVVDITPDVVERIRLEKLVAIERAACAAAQEESERKDKFLAILAHELRTPLHAIMCWIGAMKRSSHSDVDLACGLDIIERNLKLQSRLVSDLFEFSRARLGRFQLELGCVDMCEIVTAAVSSATPVARSRDVAISATCACEPLTIQGDPSRLQQVFGNLIANAVKFSPPGSEIEVRAERKNPGWLAVEVKDRGPGIEVGFLSHLFEPAAQKNASARSSEGLGLGLAIVKQITELHGGHVFARNNDPEPGASFLVYLPVAGGDVPANA